MKKSLLTLAVCATVAISVFLTGCANSAGGGKGGGSTGGGGIEDVYVASAELSDFLRSVLGGYTTNSAPSGDMSDTFVIDATDFSSAKDFDIMLKVGLAGKNIIIDAPTKDELKGLAAAIKSYLSGNEDLSAEYDAADFNSLEFLAAQFEGLSGTEKAYEAVGLRGSEIYYVHRFDEVLDVEEWSEPVDSSLNIRSMGTSENISAASRAANDDDIEAFAAKKFAEWISKVNDEDSNARYMSSKDMAGFRAAGDVPDINNLVKAQTFRHSVKVQASSTGMYALTWELFEMVVDVWTACNIDTQEDFYLVHQQVAANNDQLGYTMKQKMGPFMYEVESRMNLDFSRKKEVRDLSPRTTVGSESFTTGTSFSITGQVGLSLTGPSESLSGGLSWSQSSSTNILDISILQTLEKDRQDRLTIPVFKFQAPRFQETDYIPKNIQINRAVFDTYAVFVTESSSDTWSFPYETLICNNNIVIANCDSYSKYFFYSRTHTSFEASIRKPSNVKKNYIMSFTSPATYSLQDIAVLQAAVKKFNHFWGENVPYYAVGGKTQLDETAKNYFNNAMNIVKKNKNVLQDSRFEGNFKFYIQDPENGTQLATEDVDF